MKCKLILILGALLLVSCSSQNIPTLSSKYRDQGDQAYLRHDYVEAERQYKAAIELAEKNDEGAQLIIALRSLAEVYSEEGKDVEVEEIHKRRLELAKRVWAQEPNNLARVYDDLAIFYLLKNRYAEAEPLYKQSIVLNETAFGSNDPKTIERIEFYTLLLKELGRNEEATQLELQAKKNKSQRPH